MSRRDWVAGISVWAAACSPPPAGDRPPAPRPSRDTPTPAVGVAPAPSTTPGEPPGPAAPDGTSASDGPFAEAPLPGHANDLGWLTLLVKTLSEKAATREQVIAYLGRDGGADTRRAGSHRVFAHSQYLESVVVYPLSHIRIDVAMDIVFARSGRPSRSTMGSALGPLQPMARAPDDFHSGTKLAYYLRGAHGTVRVFVELDRADDSEVAAVHVDVDGVVR